MNKPNPFESQNPAAEQLKKSRVRLRLAVFGALGLAILVLVPLLVQGCKREKEAVGPEADTNAVAAVDTNLPPVEPVHSNLVALPPVTLPGPVTNVAMMPVVAPVSPAAAAGEYAVAKGDSFYSIGKKFGVSSKAVADANPGVDSKKLKVGQKLNIPASASAAAAPAAVSAAVESAAAAGAAYTVKSGDTLTRIAKAHGTTVKAIKSANSLTTDKIKVGQKLKIPVIESAPAVPAAAPVIDAAPPVSAPAPVLPPPATTTK